MNETNVSTDQTTKENQSRVTVKDIAREMDLSIATVSRAFNNDPTIARKTLERVLEKGAKMGYSPNLFARSLITKKSGIAALFTSNITNPFYPEVVVKLTQRLQSIGLHTMLFSSEGVDGVGEVMPILGQYSPDIAIVLAASLTSHTVQKCIESNTPVILFNRYVSNNTTESVCCDNLGGGRLVAIELAKSGHKKLAFISGLDNASTSIDRLAGFRQGCLEMGIDEPIVISGDEFTYWSGYKGMVKLCARDDRPDAVLCANDLLAIGAMDAARQKFKLSVPNDISIVGFDDIEMASWPSYQLTTVRQPMEDMIDQVLLATEKLLQNGEWNPQEHFIPGKLMVRASARINGQVKSESNHDD